MPRGLTAAAEPRWRRRPSPRIRRGPRWSSGTMTSRATTTTPRRRRRRQRRRQRRRRRRRRCRRRAGPGHATLGTPRRLRRQPRPRPRPLRSSRRPSAGARACRRRELRWRPGAQACALGRAPPWVTRMLVRNYAAASHTWVTCSRLSQGRSCEFCTTFRHLYRFLHACRWSRRAGCRVPSDESLA